MGKEAFRKITLLLFVLLALLVLVNYFSGNLLKDSRISAKATSNVGDKVAPSVNIDSLPERSPSQSLILTGSADDNTNLKWVRVKVNDGAWEEAQGLNSWSYNANLLSGKNTVYAQSSDTSDNISPVSSRTISY